jgi:hypothetical protein
VRTTVITSVGSMPQSAMPLNVTVAPVSVLSVVSASAWPRLSRVCGTGVPVSTRDAQVQVVEAVQAEAARVLVVSSALKPLGLEVRGYGRHQDQPQAKDERMAGTNGDAGTGGDDSTDSTNPIFARDHWTSSPPG